MNRRLHGLRAWLWQRLTALYMAVCIVVFAVYGLVGGAASYAQWRAMVAQPFVSVMLALFFAAVLLHAWVGVRDVLIDYVHPAALRLLLLMAVGLMLLACAVWVLKILWVASS